MSTRVCKIDRIIVAIAIQVQAVDGVGIEVGGIVRRDESAPFGAVITGVAVVEAGIVIVVIATITNGVGVGNGGIGSLGRNRAVAPGIVDVLRHHIAAGVVNSHHIALQILQEVVRRAVVNDAARGILYIIQRDQLIVTPCFTQDLSSV